MAEDTKSKDTKTLSKNDDAKTDQAAVLDASPEPNIMFVGGDDREPEKAFQNGMLPKIVMPDAEIQRKPFFHERASEIVQISPYYKAVRPKG